MKDLEMFVGKLGIDPQVTTRIFPIFMPRSHPRWERWIQHKKARLLKLFDTFTTFQILRYTDLPFFGMIRKNVRDEGFQHNLGK